MPSKAQNEGRPSSAETMEKLRQQIAKQEVTEAQYRTKYFELRDAYWQAQYEIAE